MDINILFHIEDNLIIDYFPNTVVAIDEPRRDEEG
jgi:hypothetical protein